MICENCGKEHDGCYGSGRFCSKECARSYSTKNITGYLKEAKCIDCGKIIYIGKRASNKKCRCEDCNKIHNQITCPICGSSYDPKSGGCKNNFCKTHNIQQINNLIKYFGFDKTKLGTLEVENEFNKIKETFEYLYIDQKMSMVEIGNMFNYKHTNNLSKIFKYMNINRRTRAQIQFNAYLTGRHDVYTRPKYCQEWHTTWNGKDVFLRSSYEIDYAKELDNQQIDYDVECLRIKYWDSQQQKYRCAIPDFYIPSQNLIVEIKSIWTLDIYNMKDKFKAFQELGYNTKLICDKIDINLDEIKTNNLKYYKCYKKIDINNNCKLPTRGWIWIHKDNITSKCMPNDLSKYIEDGWLKGRK